MNNQLFDLTKLLPEKKYSLNIWTKIKKELSRRGIKGKEKMLFKQKIGFNTIDNNKLLLKEFLAWIDIYNDYRSKMPLFYEHSKQYLPLFNKITDLATKINHFKIRMSKESFFNMLGDYLYHTTGDYEFKEILKILAYDCAQKETEFKLCSFKQFSMVIDEDKNLYNVDYMANALVQENEYFKKEIDGLSCDLDKMTDMCSSKALLSKQKLNAFYVYLEKYFDSINTQIIGFAKEWTSNHS